MAHIRIARLLETGAPEAFDALLEQYGSEIQTVAYLIVRDRLDAEDILAETLITAWQKGRDLREPPPCGRGCSGSRRTRRCRSGGHVPGSSRSPKRLS